MTGTRKLKVLHVLHHSLPSPLDGYAIRSHSILGAQQAAGLDVVALTGCHDPEYPKDDVVIDGVRYHRTPSRSLADVMGIRQLGRYSTLVQRLRAVVGEERPDVIHVHSPAYNGVAALRVARSSNVPLVYEVRATWEDAAVDRNRFGTGSLSYRVSRALESYLLLRADAVVAICEGLRNEVLGRGVSRQRAFVAPNAVNIENFQSIARDESLVGSLGLKTGVVFGFIGSLFGYEGVEDLLEIVPEVLERCPDARFLIVGGGEKQREVAQRVQQWTGSGLVVYRPRVPHTEVRSYYSVMDCMVYPRRSVRLTELVTPLKPLEAMAMGKVVVGSDIGGHRELIADGETGLLYSAGSNGALRDALCRVVTDSNLRSRLSASGHRYVTQHRTWSNSIKGHLSSYEKALSSYSRPLLALTRKATK